MSFSEIIDIYLKHICGAAENCEAESLLDSLLGWCFTLRTFSKSHTENFSLILSLHTAHSSLSTSMLSLSFPLAEVPLSFPLCWPFSLSFLLIFSLLHFRTFIIIIHLHIYPFIYSSDQKKHSSNSPSIYLSKVCSFMLTSLAYFCHYYVLQSLADFLDVLLHNLFFCFHAHCLSPRGFTAVVLEFFHTLLVLSFKIFNTSTNL